MVLVGRKVLYHPARKRQLRDGSRIGWDFGTGAGLACATEPGPWDFCPCIRASQRWYIGRRGFSEDISDDHGRRQHGIPKRVVVCGDWVNTRQLKTRRNYLRSDWGAQPVHAALT